MPTQIAKNTFSKAMNLDAGITTQPQGTYREANNVRITVSEDGTMGTIENVLGNELIISSQFETTGERIAGAVALDSDLIVFTYDATDPSNIYSRIYKFVFDGMSIDSYELLWKDTDKAEEDRLNLSPDYPIKAVSRKEATDIKKVYFVDNYNYLRYINTADYLTTDGLVYNATTNDYLSAKSFGTVASVLFNEPEISSISGGGLPVGMVQYSYQLYNKNGSETAFSPATGLYHLNSSADYGAYTATSSTSFKGNAVDDNSGKSLTYTISLEDYEYTHIRVVSIHYTYYSQLPTISIVTETSIPTSGTVSFTDRGSGYLGTYTIEQFTTLAGLYKARDIASSKNYLFLAGLTENYFDIGDWDARAYRFNKNATPVSRCEEANGDVYFIYGDGTWNKVESDGTPISSGTNWNIDENADLKNLFNITTIDGQRNDTDNTYLGNFKYTSTGTIGGTGKNIAYTFETQDYLIDSNSSPFKINVNEKAEDLDGNDTVGFDGFYSPYYTANLRSYQRDETYRFGIVFFDQYGRESVAKWIGDIRMPSITDSPYTFTDGNNKVWGRSIFPKFVLDNYPEGAVSAKIVRLERTSDDKSIVTNGMLRPTVYYSGDESNHPFHPKFISGVTIKTDLQEFISPEISYYKDFLVKGNDYLEINDFGDYPTLYDLETDTVITDHLANEDTNVKFRYCFAPSTRHTTTIYAGEVVGMMEEDEIINIDGINYSGWFYDLTGAGESGYKGTSLILHTFNNQSWVYNIETLGVQHAAYRRHIYDSQYGGFSYSVRSNNEYIGCSNTVAETAYNTPIYATQGDMFITMSEHTPLFYSDNSEQVFLNIMIPIESSINTNLRYDDTCSRIHQVGSEDYQEIREEGNIIANLSQLYLYNTAYSQENTLKKYYPQPEGEEFEGTRVYNNRIIVSEKKFNGEESDNWLSFLTNNFLDVDANYGEIINIEDYNNNLLFWQPRAFGATDVDPRSLITDNNPGALVLGTGAVLSRFDYLSTMTGCSDDFGVIKTPRGFYWFDSINNLIVRYDNKSVARISKLNGVQSFLNENNFTTSLATFDIKHDEVLFTLKNGSSTDTTIVFNELVGAFTGFYGYIPNQNIIVDNKLLSTEDDDNIYIHNSSGSEYANWYDNGVQDSTIKIPVNDKPDSVKVFDVLNFPTYIYDDDTLIYKETFDSVRCYNSYQNTDTIDLVPDTNVSRKKGMWSFNTLRNALNVDPDTNPDIFSAANLDKTQLYKSRMRDLYMVIDLIYDNSSNYRLNFPYIHTKYRANYR